MNYVHNVFNDNQCIFAFLSEGPLTPQQVMSTYNKAYGKRSANYSVMSYNLKNSDLIQWEDVNQ